MPAQASLVRSAPELSRDPAPAKHRKLSAPERQARPRHCSSSPVRTLAQPKGRRGHSPHRRLAPLKAPSTDKSGKAAVPALTPVVLATQAPPSPDLRELSADDGLKGITDQPSTPGTSEAAKDLIELSAARLLPYGKNPPAPMPRGLSRGKPAMVCRLRTPSQHRSWSWFRSSSDSADSQLPAAQKEVAAPAVGRREEALERAHRSPAPPRDHHQEGLRRPSPEDSRRWSRYRSRGYWYHSRSARSRSFSHRHRSLAPLWPSQSASLQSGADSGCYSYLHRPWTAGSQAIGSSGPPGPIRSTKGPRPGQVTWCSGPGPRTNTRSCRRL
ncbi:hypothetical protein UY3_00877 [Chelonia mydas]|uniref:Uncharacterized protein n=1 Tax=Chelonia mydas TaxID=8469 RepID=M7CL32_CHEMY|nr:hypothetical protein UY3_00877 [Chelonia mydas]